MRSSATATSSSPRQWHDIAKAPTGGRIKDFERQHIAPQQAARYEADVWEENIAGYIKTQTKVTIGDVAREALNLDKARIGTAEQRRIAAALETLGWRRQHLDGKTDWQGKRWWVPA